MFGGYDITLEQFITRYYLVIKKDNRLRQFVILYLSKILQEVKTVIEYQLLTKLNRFNFAEPNAEAELKKLEKQKISKQVQLMKADKTPIEQQEELPELLNDALKDEDELLKFKEDVLNELKAKNPELEDDLKNA